MNKGIAELQSAAARISPKTTVPTETSNRLVFIARES